MATVKQGVPVVVPYDIWQLIMEVRAQLDSDCPGAPTPVEETLREIVMHYEHCPRAQEEAEDFCERAKAWKQKR